MGCNYPSGCCCPQLRQATSIRAATKTILQRTTVSVKATRWSTVTATKIVVAAKRARDVAESPPTVVPPLDPDKEPPEPVSFRSFGRRNVHEQWSPADPEFSADEASEMPPLLERESRHLCPPCPPNSGVSSLQQGLSIRTGNFRYCCPPRKTVRRTTTRIRTFTRVIRRTTATVTRTTTSTITIVARQVGDDFSLLFVAN